MELKKEKRPRSPKKLRRLFAGYIAAFCVGTILLAALLMTLSSVLFSCGVILPANHRELQLDAGMDRIKTSDAVTPDMIPETCGYGVFTPQGDFLYGNFDKEDAAAVWNLTQERGQKQDSKYFYSSIPRQNDVCIVRYTLTMQYGYPLLRRFLPRPEILFFLIFGIGFLAEVFCLSSSFGKDLTKKLRCLENATAKIQEQDLDFTVESSGVCEIDSVLSSLGKMKEALKVSLQSQWEAEQARREQVSALAHDIKTPLTIVRGNAELLSESELTEGQKVFAGYIGDGARQMEQYVKILIDLSRAEAGYSMNKENLDTDAFLAELRGQISALAAVKKISLYFESGNLPQHFRADEELLKRAVLNVASNAVDFSPENGTLQFKAEGTGGRLRFCIVDSGGGFSAEALKSAKQQFYMGDKSRTGKSHYGMGLFIANTIAMQHGGSLGLENDPETGGGKVTIEIPVDVES